MDCAKLKQDIARLTEAKKDLEDFGEHFFDSAEGQLSDLESKEKAIDGIRDEILQNYLTEFAEKNQIISGYDSIEAPDEFGTYEGDVVPLPDGRLLFYSEYDIRVANKDGRGSFEMGEDICDMALITSSKVLPNGDVFFDRCGEEFYVVCSGNDGKLKVDRLNDKDYFKGEPYVKSLPNGDILMCGDSVGSEESAVLYRRQDGNFGAIPRHEYVVVGSADLYERNRSDMKEIYFMTGLSNGDVILSDSEGRLGVLSIYEESGYTDIGFERLDELDDYTMSDIRYSNESPDGFVTIGNGSGRLITLYKGSDDKYELAGEGRINSVLSFFVPLSNGDALVKDYNGRWFRYGMKPDGRYGYTGECLDNDEDVRISLVEELPNGVILASCTDGNIRYVTQDRQDGSYKLGDFIANIDWEVEDITGLPNGDAMIRGEHCLVLRGKTDITLEDLKRSLTDIAAKRHK
jgi:hypothetical protein